LIEQECANLESASARAAEFAQSGFADVALPIQQGLDEKHSGMKAVFAACYREPHSIKEVEEGTGMELALD